MSRTRRPDRSRDAEERGATPDALRLLDRSPRTILEIRRALLTLGHEAEQVEATVERLRGAGLLDDRRLAEHYILSRSARLRHGRNRLLRELQRRGVDAAVAARAWDEAVRAGDLDAAGSLRREVERRVAAAGGALAGKRYSRVYNALLRAGFEPDAVEAALEPFRSAHDPALAERTDDDLA